MKSKLRLTFILLFFIITSAWSQRLDETYINAWKNFYPSKSVSKGIHSSIYLFEDFSTNSVTKWLEFNERFLQELTKPNANINPIDARLLKVQIQSEIDTWKTLSLHKSSMSLYARVISNAIDPVLNADYLLVPEKIDLICERLNDVAQMSIAAKNNLDVIPEDDLNRGITMLSSTLARYKNELEESLSSELNSLKCAQFDRNLENATKRLEELLA